jgi:two-component system, NtrC family, response regulator PilR
VKENISLNKKALIVDDEPDLCELAEITLGRMDIDTFSVHDVATAKIELKNQHFDLCLTDMNLPDGNGIEIVEHIQKHHPHIPVAVITAYGNMETAIHALKSGAFDFVSKPVDLQVLRNLVTSAIKLPEHALQTDNKYTLLGSSQEIEHLRKKISKLARSQAPVFIHGESGSGKELAAHLIHNQSTRSDQAFIAINCGAIPAELMESEFFGHKKGSFTGANDDKTGLFKAADGGTLFLDEIAELPMPMQVKLLRAIQEKAIRAVGEHHEQPIDVRILSASHKNLSELVKKNTFREDLYYRINVIELNIPSLTDRADDIPQLAEYFLQQLSKKNGLDMSPEISIHAMKALCAYPFPGNVRELENILERAIALADDKIIHTADLQLPKAELSNLISQPKPAQYEPQTLMENEKQSIMQALEETRWNKTAAAKLLGITLRQLRYKLEKLDIN